MKRWMGLIALIAPLSCIGAPQDFAGKWAVTAQGHTVMVIDIEVQDASKVTGSFTRPTRMSVDQRLSFSDLHGPPASRPLREPRFEGERLVFEVASVANPQDLMRLSMEIAGPELAHMQLLEAPVPPFALARVGNDVDVARDWLPEASYRMDQHIASNRELAQLYEADQAPRMQEKIDWSVVSVQDAARRERLRAMLAAGEVRTGKDFERAAMIFQHGDKSDDYLLAHTLAVIAVGKGNAGALWISTATLDRYLHNIGQPQIYGTQFPGAGTGPTAKQVPLQGAFNSALISDALRKELGVPPLAEQEAQLRMIEEMLPKSTAK